VLGQAAGFAFLAALSPTALLVGAVYLGSASPRKTTLAYLAGAMTVALIVAVIVLLALHAGGLSHPHQRQPRYGLRLGLGVLALAAGAFVARRKARPAGSESRQGLLARMMTRPAPATAFAVGLLVFAPSVTFIAAAQVIATARASSGLIVVAVAVIVLIYVMAAWLPLALHLIAPDQTTLRLRAFDSWLRANGRVLLAGALLLAGLLLVINGIGGLVA